MALPPSPRIGPYEVQALLGKGGMGEAYSARDTRLNRVVVRTLLSPDKVPDEVEGAVSLQEARAASALNHPNIVAIHYVLTVGDTTFLAMECVPGKSARLASLDSARKRVAPLQVACVLAATLASVQFISA